MAETGRDRSTRGGIVSPERMRHYIRESHQRSQEYGICQEERNIDQHRLSAEGLAARQQENRVLYDVVTAHIGEFYSLLSPEEFMVALVDSQGYILHQAGDDSIKTLFAQRNCTPGYRWQERDVGTTAISLCLRLEIPVQLNDTDHYCRRGHGFTSSAAPIFGHHQELAGVLVISGRTALTHLHTLSMIASTARSIEEHLRLLRRNRELSLYAGFLDNVLEGAGTGLLTIDRELCIHKANRKGKEILGIEDPAGRPLVELTGLRPDLQEIAAKPELWQDRECYFKAGNRTVHFFFSAQPVFSPKRELLGAVLVFEEFGTVKKIAEKITGAQAFFTFDHLIGSAPRFVEAVNLARRAAAGSSTVLLLGETGTGKELFAQAIHNASPRSRQPFVPINCGAIPGELIESELFGYVDGAFTGALKGGRLGKFELADGGTLLLDEIGDMPHNMQVKLLRVLQTGEIQPVGSSRMLHLDVRIIAATHVKLVEAVVQNSFRQDLYYRLNIMTIRIPPLRERGCGDIEALARHFISRNRPGCRLGAGALQLLCDYGWPGNVRELENTIQRALHLCEGDQLLPGHFELAGASCVRYPMRPGTLRELEQQNIVAALAANGANMAKTARQLGISRATLYRKVKEYALTP